MRELEEIIRNGKPGDMLPSYSKMIRNFGVGQNTIDRVIREFDSAGLIIRKAGKGIFISPRASQKTIGFVLGRDIFAAGNSPICAMLMNQCQTRASRGRENFKFYVDLPEAKGTKTDVPLHQELADDIRGGRLDGIILVWSYGPQETEWIRSFNLPIVSLGAEGDIDAHSVIIDYIDLIRKGTSALAAAGARKIAMLSPSGYLRTTGFTRDIDTFRNTLVKHGLKFDPDLVLEDRSTRSINAGGNANNEELGFELMANFLAKHRSSEQGYLDDSLPIDGLLCEDDMFTRGALAALHQASVGLENGLKIASHANKGSSVLKNYKDRLILLEIDPEEVVEAMFDLLEPMMAAETPNPQKIYLKPRIVDMLSR